MSGRGPVRALMRAAAVATLAGGVLGCAPEVGVIVPQELHATDAIDGWRSAARAGGIRLHIRPTDVAALLSSDGFVVPRGREWWQLPRREPQGWVLLGGTAAVDAQPRDPQPALLVQPLFDRREALQQLGAWLAQLADESRKPVFLAIAPALGSRQTELSIIRAAFESGDGLVVHSYTVVEGQLRELDRFTTDTARPQDYAAVVLLLGSATPRAIRVLSERTTEMAERPPVIAEFFLAEHAVELRRTLAAEGDAPSGAPPDAWIALDVGGYLRSVGEAVRQETPWPTHLFGRFYR